MAPGRKKLRKGVPHQQNSDVDKRHDAKDDRKNPVGPVKAKIHKSLLTDRCKETVKDGAVTRSARNEPEDHRRDRANPRYRML